MDTYSLFAFHGRSRGVLVQYRLHAKLISELLYSTVCSMYVRTYVCILRFIADFICTYIHTCTYIRYVSVPIYSTWSFLSVDLSVHSVCDG